jgi:hypothetical protein
MVDRDALESQWNANESRLNEIAAMTGLGREMTTCTICPRFCSTSTTKSYTVNTGQSLVRVLLKTASRNG